MHRVQSYLHPSTLQALIKKVEEVLVRDQLEDIYGEAKALLHDEKHQGTEREISVILDEETRCIESSLCFFFFCSWIDLALLFKLVSRVPNATVELKKIVENHIYQMGTDAIERTSSTAINVSGAASFPYRHNPLSTGPQTVRRDHSRYPHQVLQTRPGRLRWRTRFHRCSRQSKHPYRS